MRKRITILVAAVVMALTMAFGSVTAFAAFTSVCSNHPEKCQTSTTQNGNSTTSHNYSVSTTRNTP
jgi:hypothetical protein